jgi:hypothetical protein
LKTRFSFLIISNFFTDPAFSLKEYSLLTKVFISE